MTVDNLFEKASRQLLRFPSPAGLLSTEDLWSLPLTGRTGRANLDDIARSLHRELEENAISFVESPRDNVSELKFEIVKHVIAVRLEERKQAAEAKDRADRKQQLLAIVSQKESEELQGKSLEELRALIAEL